MVAVVGVDEGRGSRDICTREANWEMILVSKLLPSLTVEVKVSGVTLHGRVGTLVYIFEQT